MHAPRPTPRTLGIPLAGVPGPANAITDVPGVAVGYCTQDALRPDGMPFRSGVTAILPLGDAPVLMRCAAGLHAQNGNGELTGSHWLRDSGRLAGPVMITNTHAVGAVHEGTVRWLIDRHPGLFRDGHAWALPVVAETYDGFTNDILGLHVRPAHAQQALDAALAFAASARNGGSRCIAQGNVGGGTGMQSFGLKGGSGSSSRLVDLAGPQGGLQGVVGVFVQSNFGTRAQLRIAGVPVGMQLRQGSPFAAVQPETGSLIAVVVTDLPLDAKQLEQVARRTPMGLARLGGTAGNHSGEIALALSTAHALPAAGVTPLGPLVHATAVLDEAGLDAVYEATVQATEEAVLNAMFAADTMPTHRPPGLLERIDTDQLRALLDRHHLLHTDLTTKNLH